MSERKKPPRPALSPARRWLFRLLAAFAIPALVFTLAEVGLRLAGFGHPSSFLLESAERAALFTNQKFGWRFFPPAIARTPVVFELSEEKPGGTHRIFVVGGSAALGTPEAGFGLAPMLEAILEERHPGVDFEVANAAMTAINSHVVLPIVRDLARAEPDLVVVYLGNNEVVGPHGGGTVFGGFSTHLGLVRAGIALRSLRLGQALEALGGRLGGSSEPRRWRGMEMFLERRIARTDPRLDGVYGHYRHNLEDIVAAARGGGARVVLSTVAVNLEDNPPFASEHRAGLGSEDLDAWEGHVRRGREALLAGELESARSELEAASRIDGDHAELHHLLGRLELAAGNATAARTSFIVARDLDTLRFRADSEINAIVREVAEATQATLYDAEEWIADRDPRGQGLPGRDLFHEHVHFNFAGNHALAAGLTPIAEELLGLEVRGPIPPPELCAERLAHTELDRMEVLAEIERMTSRPPFTAQTGHAAAQVRRRRHLAEIRRGLGPVIRRRALEHYRQVLGRRPADLALRARLAGHLSRQGELEEAEGIYRDLLGRRPEIAAWRNALALVLTDRGQTAEAREQLEQAQMIWPGLAVTHANLGSVLEKEGEIELAEAEYLRALEIDPESVQARFNLGTLYFRHGELAEAEVAYRRLLEHSEGFAPAHHNLGGVLEALGRHDEALTRYRRAIEIDPGNAPAHNSLGLVFERQRRLGEALESYRRAVEADPRHALAQLNLADLLLGLGHAEEAIAHYRAGLRERPENAQGWFNLALAETLVGREAEARAAAERSLEAARAQGEDELEARLEAEIAARWGLDPGSPD